MKAALFYKVGKPLEIEEVPIPEIGSGEVLIKVKACGICHTDLKILEGLVPTVKLPRILGHEIAGEVVEVGEDVTNIDKGDSVVVYPYITCGTCYFCRNSMENYCINLFNLGRLGFELDGGLSEYIKCPSLNVFKFSKEIPFEKITILPDAVTVPYHAIKRKGKLAVGEDVTIIGLGGIGIHAMQIANACGANVFGVTSSPQKLDVAKQFGIGAVICSREVNAVEEIKRATGGKGVDMVVDTVGISATLDQALKMVRFGGRVIVIGYEYGESFNLPVQHVVYYGIEIIGSRGGIKQDIAEAIKLVEMGRVQPVISKIFDLKDINAAIDYLREERPIGRVVVREPSGS